MDEVNPRFLQADQGRVESGACGLQDQLLSSQFCCHLLKKTDWRHHDRKDSVSPRMAVLVAFHAVTGHLRFLNRVFGLWSLWTWGSSAHHKGVHGGGNYSLMAAGTQRARQRPAPRIPVKATSPVT